MASAPEPPFDREIGKTDVDGEVGAAIFSQTANREGKRLMPLGEELIDALPRLLFDRAPSRVRPRDRKRYRVHCLWRSLVSGTIMAVSHIAQCTYVIHPWGQRGIIKSIVVNCA